MDTIIIKYAFKSKGWGETKNHTELLSLGDAEGKGRCCGRPGCRAAGTMKVFHPGLQVSGVACPDMGHQGHRLDPPLAWERQSQYSRVRFLKINLHLYILSLYICVYIYTSA